MIRGTSCWCSPLVGCTHVGDAWSVPRTRVRSLDELYQFTLDLVLVNPSRETKFSGTHGDRGQLFSLFS